jgi:hypothetical protein
VFSEVSSTDSVPLNLLNHYEVGENLFGLNKFGQSALMVVVRSLMFVVCFDVRVMTV